MLIKITRRQFYVAIKIIFVFIVFGLYFVLLVRESMNALENGKRKVQKIDNSAHHANDLKPTTIVKTKSRKYQNVKKSSEHLVSSNAKAANRAGNSSKSSQHHQTTLNPVYEYSEEMNAAAERDFTDRRATLWNICSERKIIGKYPPNAWEFFISPGHGISWCNIFKAASSTWMYYFNILGGYDVHYLQRTKASPLELARKRFPRPNNNELNEYFPNTISFLIVREPFERLLSAYRNKLEGYRNKYYKLLGEQIVKKFRKKKSNLNSANNKKKEPKGPTFKEFLLFLIDHFRSGGRFDEHWSPIYSFCTPCSINFTLIAKVETFQRDSEYIIRQAGLETLLLNKLPKHKIRAISNRSTSDTKILIPKYFSQIDKNLLDDILDIYELDFELFGYNSSKYYDYLQSY